MRPMTLFCVVLGALLGFLETSGQGRDVNPEPPVAKARAVASLGELPVEVSIDGYRAAVVFTMPDSASGQSARYSASIEDLSGSDLGEVSGAKEVAEDGRLELRMSGPKLAAPADGIDYVVVYRIKGRDGVWEGRRSLYYCMKRTLMAVTPPTVVALNTKVRIPVRVMHTNQQPAAKASVSLTVKSDGKTLLETTAQTDEFGTAVLEFPARKTGSLQWEVRSQAAGAMPMTSSGTLDVADAGKLLLTLDKPLYQPGQTVHIRSLLLEKPSLKPRANQGVVFEGFDTKGNKIFKHRGTTNEFGVVSTTLSIGSQVHLGAWRIEAKAGDVVAQKSFTVDRYALPKFKGSVELDKPFYGPAEEVNGTINLKYFFGKPVAGGKVKVTAHDYQGQWVVHRVIEGETNAEGLYKFAYRLPEKLIGQPLGNGNAIVLVEFEGQDTAGQSWKDSRQVMVVANPLSVSVVPESGTLVPAVENRLHIIVADAGGSAITGTASVTLEEGSERSTHSVTLDASGLASLMYTPKNAGQVVAGVTVDVKGQTLTQRVVLNSAPGQTVLLRPSKSIAAVGDTVVFDVLSSDTVGDAWVDITRENQTVLTANVRMKKGRGQVSVTLDATMAGTLTASAYTLTYRAELTRDSRVLFVNTAGDLKVKVTADKQQYKPAEKAKIDFNVTDAAGKAVQAALGIHVVDEAVFALSESKPGLAKLYFLLEAAIMEPSWQVGPLSGQTLGGLMEPIAQPELESDRQLKAEIALAARGEVATAVPAFLVMPTDVDAIAAKMQKRSERLQKQLIKLGRRHGKCSWEQETWRNMERLDRRTRAMYQEDPWGNPYQVDVNEYSVTVSSAGPDEQYGTDDDIYGLAESWAVCEHDMRYKGGVGAVRGGWGRGIGDMVMEDAAIPMATGAAGPMMEMRREAPAKRDADKKTQKVATTSDSSSAEPEVRVRQWFPETLFVEDCLITDTNGNASLEVPLADSITSWRMTTMASDKGGRMGGSESGIIVFQDFFVDIDFPAFLTRNDEVSFPVVIYNYLDKDQEIRISLDKEPWFELSGESEFTVRLAAGQVKALRFPVKVTKVGWHQLTVWGRGEKGVADAVRRTVEVRSDGMEVVGSNSGQFDPTTKEGREVRLPYAVPESAVEGSQKMWIQILPALTTHVIGGIDSLLRLPGGCFEQTTSSAWPNVLAMRYLRDTKQNTPELTMKAMQFILSGYQRILTFECRSGGFNWWEGENPGNLILSALAIMMLSDTKEVLEAVDTKVIQRAYNYLLTLQKGDGSFAAETHLHAGNENLGQDALRSTCYVAWAFNEGGFAGTEAAKKAQRFIQGKLAAEQDLYTLALCANALATLPDRTESAIALLDRIFAKAVRSKKFIYFEQSGRTLVNSAGVGGQVELTALIAHAALRARTHQADIMPIVDWLVSTKDPQGNWGYNTQASVMALKVFLLAASMGSEKTDATVTMTLNGRELATRKFDDFNKDVLWQVDVPAEKMGTRGELLLTLSGEGGLGYQVVGTWFEPAAKMEKLPEPLQVEVQYDRTQIKVDETVTVGVTVKANDPKLEGMVMLTLGVPPGFDVQTEDLDLLRSQRAISKWELTGRQLLVYLNGVPKDSHLGFQYRIKARYPVKAATGESEVHMYYDAQKQGRHAGTQLVVE